MRQGASTFSAAAPAVFYHIHQSKGNSMTALRMSADGRAKLMQREGVRTKAYRDSVGVWTIGVGHTAAAGPPHPVAGMEISRAEVDRLLSRDLGQYEKAVNAAVRVPLSQGQFDALVSFCFNIGIGGFKGSTVVKLLNKRDYRGAADAFMKWVKPPEIRGRRESERQQFVRATYAQIAEAKIDAGEGTDAGLTAKDLRQAGSRTIAGADEVKRGIIGVASSAGVAAGTAAVNSGVDPSEVISKVSDAAEQAKNIHDAAQAAPDMLANLQSHWEWVVIAVLLAACAYFAWRAWQGAKRVEAARVDDANSSLRLGG
jgi:lysozyme